MGHDIHFLERLERLSMPQADFALALYRDPELVRFVARDGGFVTAWATRGRTLRSHGRICFKNRALERWPSTRPWRFLNNGSTVS